MSPSAISRVGNAARLPPSAAETHGQPLRVVAGGLQDTGRSAQSRSNGPTIKDVASGKPQYDHLQVVAQSAAERRAPATIVWPGFSLADFGPPSLTREVALRLT